MSELTHQDVDTILRIIDRMEGREVSLEIGGLKVHVKPAGSAHDSALASTSPTSPVADAAAPAATGSRPLRQPAVIPAGHVAVRAPTMGTFFRAPSPGAKPYVDAGDHVEAGDTVCVFEVMKLFSSLTAGVTGTVTAILAANETLVEQDEPLILILPD